MNGTSPLVRPRLLLGIVTLLLGAAFLADQAGGVSAESAVALWPIGVVALGLVLVLQPDPVNRRVGAVLLVAGVWLLCNALGWWSYSLWRGWPYLLVLFGGWLLYRVHALREREGPEGRPPGALGRFDERITDAPFVGALAFGNAVERVVTARSFDGGDVDAVLGDCHIDLSGASSARGAVIDTLALLGRVVVTVPPGWAVESRVLPLLGRASDTCPGAGGTAPALVVQGAAIFGAVEVRPGE